MQEISLGDFILTGGEIAAQALIDSVVRNIPNVLGNELSITNESFNDGLLEHPQYTKPSDWDGQKVPKVLLSGDHGEIVRWRNNQALEITKKRRPDLLKKFKKKLHDLPITSLHKQKKVK
jgi:tRNA (guanine37-N1)-methyltransferase